MSFTLASEKQNTGRQPFVAGLFYGAAYLTKAVALPITLLSLVNIALLRVLTRLVVSSGNLYGRTQYGGFQVCDKDPLSLLRLKNIKTVSG